MQHQSAHQRAQCAADGQAATHRPHHVDQEPAHTPFPERVQAQQTEAKHDKRKGGAVVEAAFSRQSDAKAAAVLRVSHLHVGGQHRVRGRQNGAQQHGRAQGQAQRNPGQRDEPYRQHHRAHGQTQREQPAPIVELDAELETDREQRHDNHDLGQMLEQLRVGDWVEAGQTQPERADGQTYWKVEHGGAERQMLERRAAQCHQHQQASHDQCPGDYFHGVPERLPQLGSDALWLEEAGRPDKPFVVAVERRVTNCRPAHALRALTRWR